MSGPYGYSCGITNRKVSSGKIEWRGERLLCPSCNSGSEGENLLHPLHVDVFDRPKNGYRIEFGRAFRPV